MSGSWLRGAFVSLRQWLRELADAWDRFWFAPTAPHTLALIRLLSGLMLLYTHFVWMLDLRAFFGPDSWLSAEAGKQLADYYWTPLWLLKSMAAVWIVHIVGMLIIAMSAAGLFTRVTTVLSWLLALCYCHRQHGALFGLDQVNVMLAMYVMLGPSGACFSLDRWRARRRGDAPQSPQPTVSANIALRLIQIHMCVIYLFGGIGKMQGGQWWDGSAVWYAVANYEYQSMDMTWLGQWPFLVALLTHVTTFWEAYYIALVWPRLTRPIALALAVAVHLGIALFLGMITFGTAMIIANMAFIPSAMIANRFQATEKLQSAVAD